MLKGLAGTDPATVTGRGIEARPAVKAMSMIFKVIVQLCMCTGLIVSVKFPTVSLAVPSAKSDASKTELNHCQIPNILVKT